MRVGVTTGLVLCLLGAACTTGPNTEPDTSSVTQETTTTAGPAGTLSRDASCPTVEDRAWEQQAVAGAETLAEYGGGLQVRAVEYPIPDQEGNPWSQWGQGVVLPDGRFLSAVGDHLGPDGNSWFFVFDPISGELTRIGDVLSVVDREEGAWGFGKVHAQMRLDACGDVLVTTYWGTRRDLEFGGGYDGDVLIRIDPVSETYESLGVFFERHGVPSLAIAPSHGLLYGEAVDPSFEDDTGSFVVYDLAESTVVFESSTPGPIGFRAMAVDGEERVYVSTGTGSLSRYDPSAGTWEEIDDEIPGDFLRAATIPDPAGVVYAVSQDPDVFFSIDPEGHVTELAKAVGYTAGLALDSERGKVYSVPEAHGDSWEIGTPLMALDTVSGDLETLVELNPPAEETLGLKLGGTYDIVFDSDSRRLYIGFNAAPVDSEESFGGVVLVIVDMP